MNFTPRFFEIAGQLRAKLGPQALLSLADPIKLNAWKQQVFAQNPGFKKALDSYQAKARAQYRKDTVKAPVTATNGPVRAVKDTSGFATSAANIRRKHSPQGRVASTEPFAKSAQNILASWSKGVPVKGL
jgi:hypothetical protein